MHLPRAQRYLLPLARHATPRKVANALWVETELRLGRTHLTGYPYYFFIDVCNVCNLRCPLCPTGLYTLDRDQGMMSFGSYRAIFDAVKRYALVVSLYNLGEPFLNKQIFDMIEYTQSANVGTNLSSNFNWPLRFDVRDIVRSGLEFITASIDGITQETYSRYRVKGNLEEAFDNLRALVAARNALGKRTPFIEWQYIVFRHNEHELLQVQQMAEKLGVDRVRFVSPTIPPEFASDGVTTERFLPLNPLYREYDPARASARGFIQDKSCFYLYRTMTVDPDGSVMPCCFGRERGHTFGNLLKSPLEDIWNNPLYLSARALFSRQPLPANRVPVLCDVCPMYKQCDHPRSPLGAGSGALTQIALQSPDQRQ